MVQIWMQYQQLNYRIINKYILTKKESAFCIITKLILQIDQLHANDCNLMQEYSIGNYSQQCYRATKYQEARHNDRNQIVLEKIVKRQQVSNQILYQGQLLGYSSIQDYRTTIPNYFLTEDRTVYNFQPISCGQFNSNVQFYSPNQCFNRHPTLTPLNANNQAYDNSYMTTHIPISTENKRQLMNSQLSMPAIDHPDPYIHYLFLRHFIDNPASKINIYMVSYILQFLGQQNCPFPVTALTFIVKSIPDFATRLAKHQLQYLIKIITAKFCLQVDYLQEYNKVVSLDWSQAPKMVQLMSLLAQFWYSVGNQQKCLEFCLNQLVLCSAHLNHIRINQPNNPLELHFAILLQDRLEQLFGYSKKLKMNPETAKKVAFLLYNYLPNDHMLSTDEKCHNSILSLTNIFSKSPTIAFEQQSQKYLYNLITNFFLKELTRISKNIRNLEGQLSQCKEVKLMFEEFSFRALNAVSLGFWSRIQKIQLIKLVSACKFLCGIEADQDESGYNDLISFAFELGKRKNRMNKHQEQVWCKSQNKLQLSDDW